MNQETQSIFDAKQINITPEMLQEIIIIQQAGLFSLQNDLDCTEAELDLGYKPEGYKDLFGKVLKLVAEFEDNYSIALYKVLQELLNMKEIYNYLYKE